MNAPISTAWPPELALELALGLEDEAAICARYGIDHDALNALLCTPAFQAQLTQYRRDLHENGEIFRAKARMQAELLLDKSFRLINDPATPANVKADLIKSTVEWAGLKPSAKGQSETLPAFSITFNLPLPSGAPAPSLPRTATGGARASITVDNQ